MNTDLQALLAQVPAIQARRDELEYDGRFIADHEQRDEDGLTCPTGYITYIETNSDSNDEFAIKAGWFSEPEDSDRFIALLADQRTLLALVQALSAENEKLAEWVDDLQKGEHNE